jgi:hypothetical protein
MRLVIDLGIELVEQNHRSAVKRLASAVPAIGKRPGSERRRASKNGDRLRLALIEHREIVLG